MTSKGVNKLTECAASISSILSCNKCKVCPGGRSILEDVVDELFSIAKREIQSQIREVTK